MNATRWWLLGLAAVSALAFSAGRMSVRPSAPIDPLREIAALRFDWLGITSTQAAEIERLTSSYRTAIEAVCDKPCAARCRLVHYLTGDEWDGEMARAAVKAMCEQHERSEFAALQYIEALRQILSPEQRAQLMRRIGECLCKTCAEAPGSCYCARDDLHPKLEE